MHVTLLLLLFPGQGVGLGFSFSVPGPSALTPGPGSVNFGLGRRINLVVFYEVWFAVGALIPRKIRMLPNPGVGISS